MLMPLSLAALAMLSACNNGPQTETINDTIDDPMAKQLANAAPVDLPPPMISSKSYRCKDNSLVIIDFFQGDTLANIRMTKDASPVQLKAPEVGKPMVADGGYQIEGTGSTVTVTVPGKAAQSCKS